jgi:hypothetical protein
LRPNAATALQQGDDGEVERGVWDCDAGMLTVKRNGRRLGVAISGLTGEFCWAMTCWAWNAKVRIAAADLATF